VTVTSVRSIVAYAEKRGVKRAEILSAAMIHPATLGNADGRVRRSQIHSTWQFAAEALDDPCIGLHVAKSLPVGTFDVMDYMLATSQTVREGLDALLSYLRLLLDQAALEVHIEGDIATCRFRLFNDDLGLERYSAEFVLSLILSRIRACADVSGWHPLGVKFAHPLVGDATEYERFFGEPVTFASGVNELVLPLLVLDAPMKRADAGLNSVLLRHADELLAKLPPVDSFEEAVRQAVYQAMSDGEGLPATEQIAKRVGVGTRTLQRRLQDAETSFNRIVDDMRLDLATRMLGDSQTAIGEIGFMLGFSEPSAFSRAFRRWTGRTPMGVRKELSESRDFGSVARVDDPPYR
jgi:AraC-like DNA-binding protein